MKKHWPQTFSVAAYHARIFQNCRSQGGAFDEEKQNVSQDYKISNYEISKGPRKGNMKVTIEVNEKKLKKFPPVQDKTHSIYVCQSWHIFQF